MEQKRAPRIRQAHTYTPTDFQPKHQVILGGLVATQSSFGPGSESRGIDQLEGRVELTKRKQMLKSDLSHVSTNTHVSPADAHHHRLFQVTDGETHADRGPTSADEF